ncbi:TerB family tellurite resistance protein [Aureivirga sp. CE67]|uniref:TerB family tellurite resistance protein n=1 Tax=Aureivirga sp. CE67 TaxID=1788983 RepID=UPI0018C9D693|nr:TerB family tellurite resistance protein [Aureivirga sp. CE67]
MQSHAEKLSLLSQLIQFAKSDAPLNAEEYNFIVNIAEQLGVEKPELNSLLVKKVSIEIPKEESDRIVQFHRLVLLMNIDDTNKSKELEMIRNIGLKMGLSPIATDKVLETMHRYEDKIVPTEVLISIFQRHYN